MPPVGGAIYLEIYQNHEAQIEWNDPDEVRIGQPFNVAVYDTPQDQLVTAPYPPEPEPFEYTYAKTARILLASVTDNNDTRPGWLYNMGTEEEPDYRKIVQVQHHDMRLSHWALNGLPSLWPDPIGRQYNP